MNQKGLAFLCEKFQPRIVLFNKNKHHNTGVVNLINHKKNDYCLSMMCFNQHESNENPLLRSSDQPTERTLKDPLQQAMREQQERLEEKTEEIVHSVIRNYETSATMDDCPECKYKLDDDGIDKSLNGMGRILKSQMKNSTPTNRVNLKSPLTSHSNSDPLITREPVKQK